MTAPDPNLPDATRPTVPPSGIRLLPVTTNDKAKTKTAANDKIADRVKGAAGVQAEDKTKSRAGVKDAAKVTVNDKAKVKANAKIEANNKTRAEDAASVKTKPKLKVAAEAKAKAKAKIKVAAEAKAKAKIKVAAEAKAKAKIKVAAEDKAKAKIKVAAEAKAKASDAVSGTSTVCVGPTGTRFRRSESCGPPETIRRHAARRSRESERLQWRRSAGSSAALRLPQPTRKSRVTASDLGSCIMNRCPPSKASSLESVIPATIASELTSGAIPS